jgi:hypothetical protein
MRPERERRLVAAAAAYLRQLGFEGVGFELRLKIEGQRFVIEQDADGWPEETAMAPRPRGKWLSPLEQRVFDFLGGRGFDWTPGEAIARELDEPYQHRFKAIMSNLVEREVIDMNPGQGYRRFPRAGEPDAGGPSAGRPPVTPGQ